MQQKYTEGIALMRLTLTCTLVHVMFCTSGAALDVGTAEFMLVAKNKKTSPSSL